MTERGVSPQADNPNKGIGTSTKKWSWVWSYLVNALTLTAQATGFTIAGGTTSKTLTVDETVALSNKYTKNVAMTNTAQPAFLAYNSVTDADVTGDGTTYAVICDTEIYDLSGSYDTATGVFTAPITGRYHFNVAIYLSQMAAANYWSLLLMSSNRYYSHGGAYVPNSYQSAIISLDIDMDAGDTVFPRIAVSGGTKIIDVYGAATNPATFFSGYLIC